MRWEKIGVVWYKEMLDTVRDQRSLFLMIVLPLVLYPAMLLLGGSLIGRQEARENAMTVSVVLPPGPGSATLRDALAAGDRIDILESPDPRARIADGGIDLAIVPEEGFDAALSRGGSPKMSLYYDGAESGSREARDRVRKALDALRDRERRGRLAAIGAGDSLLTVMETEEVNVASKQKMTGFAIGALVPYLLTILIATGAFHTAVDATAGEKERNTLETVLVSSAGRLEIVLGKYAAIVTASLVATFMGIIGLVFTFVLVVKNVPGAGHTIAGLPPSMVPVLFVMAVPLALLLSAVLLTIGCFARSTKEAQTFFSYFQFLVILLAMMSMVQDVRGGLSTYMIPVLNVAMVQREMLLGIYNPTHAAITIVSTLAMAGVIFSIGTKLFSEERVMFRAR